MLTEDCLRAYQEEYPLDTCGIDEEEGYAVIESSDGRRAVREPVGETEDMFLRRLQRSAAQHRNLFFEEWIRCLSYAERSDVDLSRGLCRTCIEMYTVQFPDDRLVPASFDQPARIYWKDPLYPGSQFISVAPRGETNMSFFHRLERSREAGRNLFHEEWELAR